MLCGVLTSHQMERSRFRRWTLDGIKAVTHKSVSACAVIRAIEQVVHGSPLGYSPPKAAPLAESTRCRFMSGLHFISHGRAEQAISFPARRAVTQFHCIQMKQEFAGNTGQLPQLDMDKLSHVVDSLVVPTQK